MSVAKLRCLGDGTSIVSGPGTAADGGTDAVAAAQAFGGDGSVLWSWSGPDALPDFSNPPTFDVDGSGNAYLGASVGAGTGTAFAVYALDATGQLRWSWRSDGTADSLAGIAVDNVVVVTGTRQVAGTNASDFLTTALDLNGNVLWTRDDPFENATKSGGVSVSLDGVDAPFVCGHVDTDTGALLYDASSGSTIFKYDMEVIASHSADVTNSVGRCIGQNGASGIALLGFQVH